jgi:hypothetical protein
MYQVLVAAPWSVSVSQHVQAVVARPWSSASVYDVLDLIEMLEAGAGRLAGAALPTPNVVGWELFLRCCQLRSDACISPIWIGGRQGAQVHSRSSRSAPACRCRSDKIECCSMEVPFPATVGLVVAGVFFTATDSPCKNWAGSRNCSLRWGSLSLVSAPARSSVVCVAVLSSCLPTWAGPDRRSIILRDNFTRLSLSTDV